MPDGNLWRMMGNGQTTLVNVRVTQLQQFFQDANSNGITLAMPVNSNASGVLLFNGSADSAAPGPHHPAPAGATWMRRGAAANSAGNPGKIYYLLATGQLR